MKSLFRKKSRKKSARSNGRSKPRKLVRPTSKSNKKSILPFQITSNPSDLLWGGFFTIWLILVSGVFSGWSGSPGLMQYLRLKSLIKERHIDVAKLETQRQDIEIEIKNIDKSKMLQEKMAREILGYARKDELIFDFNQKNPFY